MVKMKAILIVTFLRLDVNIICSESQNHGQFIRSWEAYLSMGAHRIIMVATFG